MFLLVLHLWPIFALKVTTENLNKQNISVNELKNWQFAFLAFQRVNTDEERNLVSSIENYYSNIDKYNNSALIKLPKLNINSIQQIEITSVPQTIVTIDPNLPLGEHIVPKLVSENYSIFQKIEINEQQLFLPDSFSSHENKQVIVVGTKNRVEFVDDIKREISNSIYSTSGISENFVINESDKEKLQHTTLGRVLINTEFLEDRIIVGSLQVFQENCKTGLLLPIEYNSEEEVFNLFDFSFERENECLSFVELDCEECSLAPIDKSTRLPSTYVPNLVATNLPGGGLLTKQTVEALTSLSQALGSQGISLYVTSGYRSYAQQQVAYNSWVTSEINKGSSPENAKIRANNYSALPGHSEHQLGTTVDVRCSGCDPFSKDLNNSPFYLYLFDHAHEYGFVISYPENKQELTGYSFEPWHIRYIGVAMATELYNLGYLEDTNEEYLSKYLREKGLY